MTSEGAPASNSGDAAADRRSLARRLRRLVAQCSWEIDWGSDEHDNLTELFGTCESLEISLALADILGYEVLATHDPEDPTPTCAYPALLGALTEAGLASDEDEWLKYPENCDDVSIDIDDVFSDIKGLYALGIQVPDAFPFMTYMCSKRRLNRTVARIVERVAHLMSELPQYDD